MNIRIMGEQDENTAFIESLENNEKFKVISISDSYVNRGRGNRKRVYIELARVTSCQNILL